MIELKVIVKFYFHNQLKEEQWMKEKKSTTTQNIGTCT